MVINVVLIANQMSKVRNIKLFYLSSLLLIWVVVSVSSCCITSHSFFKKVFYWGIVDLPCCVIFCYTVKWFSYTCICFIFIFFFIMLYLRILNIVPVLYSRTLLFIHAKYNNLLIPNFQSIPTTLPFPWQLQVCSLCLWVFFCFRDKGICVIF